MIGICKQCGKEKEIHGNGLCNACHQKNWRAEHRLPVNPNKVERDNCGKFRKWGGAVLSIRDLGADLIPEEILAMLDEAGTRLSRLGLTGGTSVEEPGEGDDGHDDDDNDAGERTAPAVLVKDRLLKQDVIDALLKHGINHSTAILHAHDSYKPGMTFDEWFDAAFVRATGLRKATTSSPVALRAEPQRIVEERNATPEDVRCVAEPVEEVSNATEKSSVALPDVTGIRNVSPAPAVTVAAELDGPNVTESSALPAIIPEMPLENINDVEAVAVVKPESDTHHETETIAEPEHSGILNKAEASKASPAVPAAEQPVSQEYG